MRTSRSTLARSLGTTYVFMGTPSERRGLGRLGAGPERSLLMRLVRGLPGVDVRVVADPGLARPRQRAAGRGGGGSGLTGDRRWRDLNTDCKVRAAVQGVA